MDVYKWLSARAPPVNSTMWAEFFLRNVEKKFKKKHAHCVKSCVKYDVELFPDQRSEVSFSHCPHHVTHHVTVSTGLSQASVGPQSGLKSSPKLLSFPWLSHGC